MQKHTKIYMLYFDYGDQDFIPCEACGNEAVDVHHINGRGKGKDIIINLMGLCRKHHVMAHDEKVTKSDLTFIHKCFISGQRRVFLK